jgi:hypothetical protein
MYVVVAKGIQIQAVLGVFQQLDHAKQAIEKYGPLDNDDYHHIETYKVPIDRLRPLVPDEAWGDRDYFQRNKPVEST